MTPKEREVLTHLIADVGSPHRRIQALRQKGQCQGERWAAIAQSLFAVAKAAALWLEETSDAGSLPE